MYVQARCSELDWKLATDLRDASNFQAVEKIRAAFILDSSAVKGEPWSKALWV